MIVDKLQHVAAGFSAAIFLSAVFRLTGQRVPLSIILVCVLVIALTTEVFDGIRQCLGGAAVFDVLDIIGAGVGALIFAGLAWAWTATKWEIK